MTEIKKPKRLGDRTKRLLAECVEHFEKEDKAARENQIAKWRGLKLLWDSIRSSYYDEVAHDWRLPQGGGNENENDQQEAYDKPVNVFRAYLESIIAALSVTIPPVKCYPDDADDALDLITAKTCDRVAELIHRHNDAPLLWLRALFIYCTEGLVACRTYAKSDEEYGTTEKEDYRSETEEHEITACPNCGYELDNQVTTPAPTTLPSPIAEPPITEPPTMEAELSGMMPEMEGIDPMMLAEMGLTGNEDSCPGCGELITPEVRKETINIDVLVGVTSEPKSRICLEMFGGLSVKVPIYARKQSQCLYLSLSEELHYAQLIEEYGDYYEEITDGKGIFDPYESWGRISTQYHSDYPENVVTKRQFWLRPAAFNILDEEERDFLRKKYPKGVKVILSNDTILDAIKEPMDEAWTLSYNPLTDHLQHDPLGLLLTSVQDITNDLISLTLQTIEHGIPQTFADPRVLDFEAYKKQEVRPGDIFPAKPPIGKGMGEGFYEVKTATLSSEVMPFGQQIQQFGQLVSGAQPALFGGQIEGSETASEYSMSRAQSLQRIGNTWKVFLFFWKNINGKAIPLFLREVQDDEKDVRKDKFGNFYNVFIRKAELQGRIGRVELEANENLPITWSQRRDTIMALLQNANPEILSIIASPENLPLIREAIGLTGFYILGEDDREKQHEEILQLLESEPIVDPTGVDQMGQPMEQEIPAIEVDLENDNHEIQFEICRAWIVSSTGRLAKTENEPGYRNVLLHAKMHQMIMQQQQMEQMMMEANSGASEGPGAAPNKKPNPKDKPAPIQEDSDVNTVS